MKARFTILSALFLTAILAIPAHAQERDVLQIEIQDPAFRSNMLGSVVYELNELEFERRRVQDRIQSSRQFERQVQLKQDELLREGHWIRARWAAEERIQHSATILSGLGILRTNNREEQELLSLSDAAARIQNASDEELIEAVLEVLPEYATGESLRVPSRGGSYWVQVSEVRLKHVVEMVNIARSAAARAQAQSTAAQ